MRFESKTSASFGRKREVRKAESADRVSDETG